MKNKLKNSNENGTKWLESIPDVPENERSISDDEIVGIVREVRRGLKQCSIQKRLQLSGNGLNSELKTDSDLECVTGLLADCADKAFEREKSEQNI